MTRIKGEKIRQLREKLGMTQDELAKKIGYKSRVSINKIELNKRNFPVSRLKEFADALKVSIEDIIETEDTSININKNHILGDKNFIGIGNKKNLSIYNENDNIKEIQEIEKIDIQLKKLKSWLDEKIIDEKEFETKKKELLKKI